MKAKNKMTDEQLAAMIERSFGFETLKFEDLESFEVASVAEKSIELIDEESFQLIDFSFDTSSFSNRFEPLAMCGFLGDEEDDDPQNPSEEDEIDNSAEEDT